MTKADDLAVTFTCAANVGTVGSGSEQPIEAAIQAFEGFLNSEGQCNEAFNRSDAFTVIIIVTDEDAQYNQNVVLAYEHFLWLEGSDENIAVLTLTEVDPNVCSNNYANASEDLIKFTEFFKYGFVGDICEPDYKPFFTNAVSVINSACEELPGYPKEP